MSATDDLRRLLDERGVEHVDAEDGHTQHTWWSDGDHEIAACNSGKRLAVYNLTPEQAVDATLGRGTCHAIEVPMGIHDDATATVCSACRVAIDELSEMNYCPNCGRAVVE